VFLEILAIPVKKEKPAISKIAGFISFFHALERFSIV
jgi:hypothetical protein